MKKILALALSLAALVTISACQEAAAPTAQAPITFGAKPPLRINVAQISVAETYRAPMQAPNVDHTLPTPPLMAIKQWAGQRLVAAGAQGTLEITIEDAAVKETKLQKKTSGVEGFFTDDPSERYDAHIRVVMRLYNGQDTISVAEGTVDASRMQTVNEKTTVAEREKRLNDMVQSLMTQFDTEAELRIRQYFAAHIL